MTRHSGMLNVECRAPGPPGGEGLSLRAGNSTVPRCSFSTRSGGSLSRGYGPLSRSAFPVPASHLRRGVTLVELLVTMVIIALIAAAIMGTASAAIEHGRRSHTQQLITRIHTLLMERWASYESRRVEIDPRLVQQINVSFPETTPAGRQLRGQAMADLRLLGLRELIRYEMPDRFVDFGSFGSSPSLHTPYVLESPPALAQMYFRRVAQAGANIDNQDAECLYMVVMFATADGEARTLFSSKDIADTDEDGLPEFIDGWGKSIGWVRWAPGFVSDLQPLDPTTGLHSGEADHDPFDVYRRDQQGVINPPATQFPKDVAAHIQSIRQRNNSDLVSAYRLTPLVYSDGPDGESGIYRVPTGNFVEQVPALDPYAIRPQAQYQYGTIAFPELAKDNIHNHLIEY
ncbi:MAG: hypothetical protein DCC67_10405 [Planctomycetota bacterium]|nr:MAG: hypothetical protein DCC67_10405 [Planctomycetota bacterium]